ncbi:MAG: CRTAC1 family protein [Anaerolineae bacterium]|nr:CRTAC1 family protein [Anaerolineae bacterium]
MFAPIVIAQPEEIVFRDVTDQARINVPHRAIWYEDILDPYENGYLATGQAWGDFNNDGWVDLYVTGNLEPNVLYINQQDGTFGVASQSEQVAVTDVPSGGAIWADYDNDGWRDLYVLNLGANRLFRNVRGEYFEDVTLHAGVGDARKGTTAAWADYDNDGFLDLYVTNWSCQHACDPVDLSLSQDVLYHNQGDGTFADVSHLLDYDRLLGAGFAASFADYDNDGDLDLYVVNDKVSHPIGNVLWRNDGAGCEGWCWTDVSAQAGAQAVVHGMGLATGDYDNDGDLDFYFSNLVKPMVLLQNQGDGTFVDRTDVARVGYDTERTVGWGTAFLDFDNDGWLDIYLGTSGLSANYGQAGMLYPFVDGIFHNRRDGSFARLDVEARWKQAASMGLATADYDHDGFVDVIVGHWNKGYRLYRNEVGQHSDYRWLTIRLTGTDAVNRDAIGARVRVTTDDGLTQMREVKSGSSLGAGDDTALHFGLGNANLVDVTIQWPNGITTTCDRLDTNQIWQISLAEAQASDCSG